MLFIKMMAAITTFLFPMVYKLFGKRGIKAWQLILYQMGMDRSLILKQELQVDVNDARSLGKIIDYDDGLARVKGTWVAEKKGKAMKIVKICPIGKILRPEICLNLVVALEAGTLYPLNPNIKVPEITKLISKGDDCCVGVIELPYLDKRIADQDSSYSTGKNYAPPINIAHLNRRL
ncbi:MAG: hypothetical protein AMJ45_06500, partial [Syntrophobacter sp. DG_60]